MKVNLLRGQLIMMQISKELRVLNMNFKDTEEIKLGSKEVTCPTSQNYVKY